MNIKDLYPELNIQQVYQNFLEDLKKSAKGEKTSLRFIKNQLPEKKDLPKGTKVQVLVIGGTICRSAIVEKISGEIKIIEIKYIDKPSFPTMETFLAFVLDAIHSDINEVVINSADTIEPVYENGKMDGVLAALSKENRMEGLLNHKLGKEIEKYILKKTKREININVANDTICLLLSGQSKYLWDRIAGGIIGTGINFALFLDNNTAINLEAGDWNNLSQSEPGKELDSHSDVVGGYIYEKEISGGYLYKHFNYFINKLGLSFSPISDSAALSQFAQNDNSEIGLIAQIVLDHSAYQAGCVIAALATFMEKDTELVMQGSVFWKGYGYKEKVSEVVKSLTYYKVDFVDIENADIIGGAKVIL